MALAPGTKLGPYDIESPLGAGGMGEVYRARDTRLDRSVAIKVLPAEFSADVVRKQRLEREAKAISSLNHPNICVLYDVGSQNGVDYLVMECVEGESLARRLEKGALPLEQILKYGAQIADGLEKAHRAGIVHRDLKPGNIMLTSSGAKLLDFGLAKPAVATRSALGVSRLTWFDREGKTLGILGPAGTYANPNLSPDGKRVAYDQRSPDGRAIGIWVQDLKSDTALRLTLHPSLNQAPVWSPDGKKIVFTSNRKLINKIYQKNSDGSGTEDEMTDMKAGRMVNPWDWSRNGKFLLERNETELWYYSTEEDKSRAYIKGAWVVRNAQFSPDGKYVAYATNETGDWEVYVSPFPEASSKWQVSRGGGEEPRWRADGKELFYVSPEGKLMAASVKLGASFEGMTPVALFQTRRRQKISSQDVFTYTVSADGNKFLFNTLMDQREAPPLSVIQNWNVGLEK